MRGRLAGLTALLVGVASLAVAGSGWSASASAQPDDPPQVDAAVQVTDTPSAARAYMAPVLATHPDNADVLALAAGEARSSACSLHVSTNAGLSWTEMDTPEPDGTRCVWSNNGPVLDVVFGPEGTLYYAFSAGTDREWPERTIYVARSNDMGQTFDSVAEVPAPGVDHGQGRAGVHAMPQLAVDPTRPDRVYVTWRSNYGVWNLGDILPEEPAFEQRPLVSVSDDRGESFSDPVDAAGDWEGSIQSSDMVVDTEGNIFVFHGQAFGFGPAEDVSAAKLFVAISRDGGESFTHEPIHEMQSADDLSVLNAPVASVGDDTGAVHVAWEDVGEGPVEILTMQSTDAGESWSDPTRVNDTEPPRAWGNTLSFPALDIAPGGRIDVAWYDIRDDPAAAPDGADSDESEYERKQHVYYSSSDDRGNSWSENLRVSDRLIDRQFGVWHLGMRGPVAVASTDDVTYFAWSDTRNATADTESQDVYFTRVRRQSADAVFRSSSSGSSSTVWAGLGGGTALLLAGLVLTAVTFKQRSGRRR